MVDKNQILDISLQDDQRCSKPKNFR